VIDMQLAFGEEHVMVHVERIEIGADHRHHGIDRAILYESKRLGLPVADPIRRGRAFEALVDSCLK